MAMGKAVIVSGTEGQRDIVDDGETGVLVPAGDPAALRAAIRRLLDNPDERDRLGRNARRAIETRFSLDVYASTLNCHLDELAEASRGRARTELHLPLRPAASRPSTYPVSGETAELPAGGEVTTR
jgi:glycogen synthase